jgi:hypothetical protein
LHTQKHAALFYYFAKKKNLIHIDTLLDINVAANIHRGTCVERCIKAKLVYKTVGDKVENSLYCSTAASTPAAAASGSQKKGKKRPDNETRKSRSEAWLQRRTVSRPDLVSTAATAASALEESLYLE